MKRVAVAVLLLAVVGVGACGGEPESADVAGVWVWDPEAETTLARQERAFRDQQARAFPPDFKALTEGAELQLGPKPPDQGLMVLVLLPNGEAGVRPEPPAFIGTATGRWTEEGKTVVVTLTESLGEPLPEPVVMRGGLRDRRLVLEATLVDGAKETWDLARFADGTDCRCSKGASTASAWCWEHGRGFLSTGESDCWRCVFLAMRNEPCRTCLHKHKRQGRLALLRGDRAGAIREFAQALSVGADEANLRFLLGQAEAPKPPSTWKMPLAARDVRVVGGLVVVRTQDPDQLQVLDGVTGRPLSVMNKPGEDPIWSVAPDGRHAAHVDGSRVLLHEIGSGAEPRVLTIEGRTFGALAFAAEAPILVGFAAEGEVIAWSMSGEVRWKQDAEPGEAFNIATDPTGTRAAVQYMSGDNDLVVCGDQVLSPPVVFKKVLAAETAFSPLNADTLAYTRWIGPGHLLSRSQPSKRVRLPDHGSGGMEPKGCWFAWGGRRLLYMDTFNVQVVDPRSVVSWKQLPDASPEPAARQLAYLQGQRLPGACNTISPDGMRFATAGDDGTVHVWAADTLALLARFPTEGGKLVALGFTPGGGRLVACHEGGQVFVFKTEPDMRSAKEVMAAVQDR